MGRDATDATQPGSVRRTERARLAKETIHKTIPALLHSDARARRGIEAAHLLVDLPRIAPGSTTTTPAATTPTDNPKKKHPKGKRRGATHHHTPTPTPTSRPSDHPPPPPLRIRILPTDTLTAAAGLLATNTRPAVLSMASPLRPGGGVFTGAQGQEESLCLRTTLYWSLRESYYRLPALGCVYTPDALVFRGGGGGMQVLAKRERFYVDVVSCAALRFPSTEKRREEGEEEEEERYECAADREAMVGKMRVVMRAAARGGVGGVVLGAWGCGAYGNPVGEVAEAWRRVLVGAGGRGGRGGGEREVWAGVGEVVFAIDGGTAEGRRQLEVFRRVFEGVACEEERKQEEGKGKGKGEAEAEAEAEGGGEAVRDEDDPEEVRLRDVQELTEEIKTKEAQLGRIKNESLRERIADLVTSLKKELAIKSGPQAHSDGENDDDDEHGPDQVEEEEEEEVVVVVVVEEEAEGSASRKA